MKKALIVLCSFAAASAAGEWQRLPYLVADEGRELKGMGDATVSDCERECDANNECHSFSMASDTSRCHLKDKCVTLDQARDHNPNNRDYVTYYKPCSCKVAHCRACYSSEYPDWCVQCDDGYVLDRSSGSAEPVQTCKACPQGQVSPLSSSGRLCPSRHQFDTLSMCCAGCANAHCSVCSIDKNQCQLCDDGYGVANQTCEVCPRDAHCKVTGGKSCCKECESGYALHGVRCEGLCSKVACPDGYGRSTAIVGSDVGACCNLCPPDQVSPANNMKTPTPGWPEIYGRVLCPTTPMPRGQKGCLYTINQSKIKLVDHEFDRSTGCCKWIDECCARGGGCDDDTGCCTGGYGFDAKLCYKGRCDRCDTIPGCSWKVATLVV
jgi:hypothetical protein